MRENVKRFLTDGIMVLFIFQLALVGKPSEAHALTIKEQTAHWIWPSNGIITDLYGTRKGVHKGIDIAAEAGSPIYAVDEGVVSKSYYSDTYGNVVFIKHSNLFETVYAHLKSRNVTEGKAVKQGEIVGRMGNTGDSSGAHLHFEIHQNEWTFEKQNAIDPVMALGEVVVGKYVFADFAKSLEVSGRTQAGGPPQVVVRDDHQGSGDQGDIVHIVKQGETLWSIAKRYGTTVQVLSSLNHLNDNKIVSNQQLVIKPMTRKQYVVQSGDTLAVISRKTSASIDQLKQWNHLRSDLIIPQQILIVQ